MERGVIKIDSTTEGYLVHYKGVDGIQDIFYKTQGSLEGLNDGLLDLLAEIRDFLSDGGSKHDRIRVFLGYRAGDISDKERIEIQKKTDWEIV